MRIADTLFRQGHLSDTALTEVVAGGDRPNHLETCDACARRLDDLGRWLDDVRSEALAAADEVFTPERLALQHSQIMRRLEQVDEPSRVLAFPAVPRSDGRRRVAPAWIGVAAAAGLVVGVIGGQVSARLSSSPETQQVNAPVSTIPSQAPPAPEAGPVNVELLDYDYERYIPDALLLLDESTPALTQDQYAAR